MKRIETIEIPETLKNEATIRGARLIEYGLRLEAALLAARPLVTLLAVGACMCATALGQSLPPTTGIFGGTSEGLGQSLRAALYLARGLCFFGGIFYILKGCWAAARREQDYTHQLFWGGVMLGVSTVITVIYTLARGQMVNLDYDLSGY